ncbi:MAG: hypothetical protein ACRDWD_16260 [Acidimicrobiia bacterium]
MATSRQRTAPRTFIDQALALAWGAWVELGVSGWASTHEEWAVDPEPLILFTAWLGDTDPRLRDEVTDWCIHNWRFVSKVRLKNLLRQQPDDARERFGEFAATVGNHAGVHWPGAMEPRSYQVTGRSALPDLQRPSLVWLRLRAIFGLGARTEILRFLLSRRGGRFSVARLAEATSYVKRNVAEECQMLERAGVLRMRTRGTRFCYGLARRSELEEFVGESAELRPDWTAVLNIARELVALEYASETGPPNTLAVKSRRSLRTVEDDLDELEIEPLSDDIRGSNLWPSVQELGQETLARWSTGLWHDTPSDAPKSQRSSASR